MSRDLQLNPDANVNAARIVAQSTTDEQSSAAVVHAA